jgi:fatty acid desaturase
MNDNEKLIESLLERTVEYGKTSFELVKLKTLDKTSEVVSSFVPHSVVVILLASLLLFLNLGIAFWLGEILGNNYYGFFIVAAFYGFLGIVVHFFMHGWIKKAVCNYIIKQVLK